MNFKLLALITPALFTLIACSSQPSDSQKNKLASQNAKPNEQGLICKFEKSTRSRIGKKVCRTPEQIEREREIAQEMIRQSISGGRLPQKG